MRRKSHCNIYSGLQFSKPCNVFGFFPNGCHCTDRVNFTVIETIDCAHACEQDLTQRRQPSASVTYFSPQFYSLEYLRTPYSDLNPLKFNKIIYTLTVRNNISIVKIIPSLTLVQKYAGHWKVFIYNLPLLFSLSKESFMVNWSHTKIVSTRNLEFVFPLPSILIHSKVSK